MSGIYIQGAEMPKSCWVCEFGGAEQMADHSCPFYLMYYSEMENYKDKIADGCPLIPVPDHGRLIDAVMLRHKCYQHYEDFMNGKIDGKTALLNIEKEIMDAPTIIPAEEGE